MLNISLERLLTPLLGWLIEHVGTLYTLLPTMRMQKMDLLHTERSKEEIGTLHYHHLGTVFSTVLELPTSWMFVGTLVYFLVFVYILLRRSLVPQKECLWFNLFEESLKINSGMWSCYSLFKARHGHQTHQLPEEHWNCAISVEQPEVAPEETKTAPYKAHFKRVYLRQDDFGRFGYSAGWKACAFLRQGLDRQGIPHDEDCRTMVVQRLQETEYGRKRIEIARKKEEDFKSEPEKKQRIEAPEIRPSISASGSGVKRRAEDPPDDPRLVPEVSEEARGTKRSADELDDIETEVTNLLQAQRRGYLGALHTDRNSQRPVCEDDLGIDPEAPQYWDNISGRPLSTEKVEEARSEEISVINQMQVWEVIDRPSNEKVIPTRWVDVNKGDEKSVKYRSRLVAKEIKRSNGTPGSWTDFFASMPPITALRILFTLAVTKKIPNLDGKLVEMSNETCLSFIDVKKAHIWSPARRRLLVELPPEAGYPPEGWIAEEEFVWRSGRTRQLGGGHQRGHAEAQLCSGKIQFLLILP